MTGFTDIDALCINCFKPMQSEGRCPHCGFDRNAVHMPPHQLPPKTVLNGKYLTGRVLGEGGFGITYIGFDLNLDIRVAIKEYFPSGFVSREVTGGNTVTPHTGSGEEYMTNGLNKFLDEARTLARFHNLPGIVEVRDFFRENGTAYIVMEFIDGDNLRRDMDKCGGRIPPERVLELMKPLIESLANVHAQGVIHRDISPDNIMLTSDGRAKLIDFGAARETDNNGRSVSVMLKPGYAPEEQYLTHGELGPWTDIYALSATMYKLITGVTPPESLARAQGTPLRPISEYGIRLAPHVEAAIMKGMAIKRMYRFKSMSELAAALYPPVADASRSAAPIQASYTTPSYTPSINTPPAAPVAGAYRPPIPQPPVNAYRQPAYAETATKPQKSRLGLYIGVGGGALALVAVVVTLILVLGNGNKPVSVPNPTPTPITATLPTVAPIPTLAPATVAPVAPAGSIAVTVPDPVAFLGVSEDSVATAHADGYTELTIPVKGWHDVANYLLLFSTVSGLSLDTSASPFVLSVNGSEAVEYYMPDENEFKIRYKDNVAYSVSAPAVTLEYLDNNGITVGEWRDLGAGYNSDGVNYCGNTPSNLRANACVAIQGDYIYYSDYTGDGGLFRISMTTGQTETLCDTRMFGRDMNVAGDWVYFTVLLDGDKYRSIYRCRASGTSAAPERIRREGIYPQVYGDYLYYAVGGTKTYCRSALDGSGEEVLLENRGYYTFVTNSKIYTCDLNGETGIYCTELDGSNPQKLSSANCYALIAHAGYLFYQTPPSEGGHIYRMDTDGTDAVLLSTVQTSSSNEHFMRMVCDGDYCYFNGEDNCLYAVDIRGGSDPIKLVDNCLGPMVLENDTSYLIFYYNGDSDLCIYSTSDKEGSLFPG